MDEKDIAEQFEKHLNSPKHCWLLGAGISYSAKIPLMIPLTNRVLLQARNERFEADDEALAVLDFVQAEISEDANIEVLLTHLSDLTSLAERSRTADVDIGGQRIGKRKLTSVHLQLLQLIRDTIRWGYFKNGDEEEIGAQGASIVSVEDHRKFIQAIFGQNRAGLETLRGPVEFFTTNYDTLLEDALALNEIEFVDGFTGGGVGFWTPGLLQGQRRAKASLTKMHGSIDWFRPATVPSPLLRVRSGDNYFNDGGEVLIYPQATKYMNALQDPFAELFQRFRQTLAGGVDQVLLVCGYSFGDDHINADIEAAMVKTKNPPTIVAFSDEGEYGLPAKLQDWRTQRSWKNHLYVVSPRGLYCGSEGPAFELPNKKRDWWTFQGVTKIFQSGLPRDVREAIQ